MSHPLWCTKILFSINYFCFLFRRKNYNPLLLLCPLLTHLTSCTPTKSNLYLDNFLTAAVSEPVLCRLLTFYVPNLMSPFLCFGCTKVPVQVRGLLYGCFATGYVFTVRSC
jgi:hypothetical protein